MVETSVRTVGEKVPRPSATGLWETATDDDSTQHKLRGVPALMNATSEAKPIPPPIPNTMIYFGIISATSPAHPPAIPSYVCDKPRPPTCDSLLYLCF